MICMFTCPIFFILFEDGFSSFVIPLNYHFDRSNSNIITISLLIKSLEPQSPVLPFSFDSLTIMSWIFFALEVFREIKTSK